MWRDTPLETLSAEALRADVSSCNTGFNRSGHSCLNAPCFSPHTDILLFPQRLLRLNGPYVAAKTARKSPPFGMASEAYQLDLYDVCKNHESSHSIGSKHGMLCEFPVERAEKKPSDPVGYFWYDFSWPCYSADDKWKPDKAIEVQDCVSVRLFIIHTDSVICVSYIFQHCTPTVCGYLNPECLSHSLRIVTQALLVMCYIKNTSCAGQMSTALDWTIWEQPWNLSQDTLDIRNPVPRDTNYSMLQIHGQAIWQPILEEKSLFWSCQMPCLDSNNNSSHTTAEETKLDYSDKVLGQGYAYGKVQPRNEYFPTTRPHPRKVSKMKQIKRVGKPRVCDSKTTVLSERGDHFILNILSLVDLDSNEFPSHEGLRVPWERNNNSGGAHLESQDVANERSITFSTYTQSRARRATSGGRVLPGQGPAEMESSSTNWLRTLQSRRTRRNMRSRPWKDPAPVSEVSCMDGKTVTLTEETDTGTALQGPMNVLNVRHAERKSSPVGAKMTHKSQARKFPSYMSQNKECDHILDVSKAHIPARRCGGLINSTRKTATAAHSFNAFNRQEPNDDQDMKCQQQTTGLSASKVSNKYKATSPHKIYRADPFPHVKAKVECKLHQRGERRPSKFPQRRISTTMSSTWLSNLVEGYEQMRRGSRLNWDRHTSHLQEQIARKVEEVVMKKAQAIVKSYQEFLERQSNQYKPDAAKSQATQASEGIDLKNKEHSCEFSETVDSRHRFVIADGIGCSDAGYKGDFVGHEVFEGTSVNDSNDTTATTQNHIKKSNRGIEDTTSGALTPAKLPEFNARHRHIERDADSRLKQLFSSPETENLDRSSFSFTVPFSNASIASDSLRPERSIAKHQLGAVESNQVPKSHFDKNLDNTPRKTAIDDNSPGIGSNLCKLNMHENSEKNLTKSKFPPILDSHEEERERRTKICRSKIPVLQTRRHPSTSMNTVSKEPKGKLNSPHQTGQETVEKLENVFLLGEKDVTPRLSTVSNGVPSTVFQSTRAPPFQKDSLPYKQTSLTQSPRTPGEDATARGPWWKRCQARDNKAQTGNTEEGVNISLNRKLSLNSDAPGTENLSTTDMASSVFSKHRQTEQRAREDTDITSARNGNTVSRTYSRKSIVQTPSKDSFYSPFNEHHQSRQIGDLYNECALKKSQPQSKLYSYLLSLWGQPESSAGSRDQVTDNKKFPTNKAVHKADLPESIPQGIPLSQAQTDDVTGGSTSSSWFSGSEGLKTGHSSYAQSTSPLHFNLLRHPVSIKNKTTMATKHTMSPRNDRKHKYHYDEIEERRSPEQQASLSECKENSKASSVDHYCDSAAYPSSLSTLRSISDLPYNNPSPVGQQSPAHAPHSSPFSDKVSSASPSRGSTRFRPSSQSDKACPLKDPVSVRPMYALKRRRPHDSLFERRCNVRHFRNVNCSNKACRISISEPNISTESEKPTHVSLRRCLSYLNVTSTVSRSTFHENVSFSTSYLSGIPKPEISQNTIDNAFPIPNKTVSRRRSIFTRLGAGDCLTQCNATLASYRKSCSSVTEFWSSLGPHINPSKGLNTCHNNSPLKRKQCKDNSSNVFYSNMTAQDSHRDSQTYTCDPKPRRSVCNKKRSRHCTHVRKHHNADENSPESNQSFSSLLHFWEKASKNFPKFDVHFSPEINSYRQETRHTKADKRRQHTFDPSKHAPSPTKTTAKQKAKTTGVKKSPTEKPLHAPGLRLKSHQVKQVTPYPKQIVNWAECTPVSFLQAATTRQMSGSENSPSKQSTRDRRLRHKHRSLAKKYQNYMHGKKTLPSHIQCTPKKDEMSFTCDPNSRTVIKNRPRKLSNQRNKKGFGSAPQDPLSSAASGRTQFHSAISAQRQSPTHPRSSKLTCSDSVEEFRRQRILDFVATCCRSRKNASISPINSEGFTDQHDDWMTGKQKLDRTVKKRSSKKPGGSSHPKVLKNKASDNPRHRKEMLSPKRDCHIKSGETNGNPRDQTISERHSHISQCSPQKIRKTKMALAPIRYYKPYLRVGKSPTGLSPGKKATPNSLHRDHKTNSNKAVVRIHLKQKELPAKSRKDECISSPDEWIHKQNIKTELPSRSPVSLPSAPTGYIISTGLDHSSDSSGAATPINSLEPVGSNLPRRYGNPKCAVPNIGPTKPRTKHTPRNRRIHTRNISNRWERRLQSNLTFIAEPRKQHGQLHSSFSLGQNRFASGSAIDTGSYRKDDEVTESRSVLTSSIEHVATTTYSKRMPDSPQKSTGKSYSDTYNEESFALSVENTGECDNADLNSQSSGRTFCCKLTDTSALQAQSMSTHSLGDSCKNDPCSITEPSLYMSEFKQACSSKLSSPHKITIVSSSKAKQHHDVMDRTTHNQQGSVYTSTENTDTLHVDKSNKQMESSLSWMPEKSCNDSHTPSKNLEVFGNDSYLLGNPSSSVPFHQAVEETVTITDTVGTQTVASDNDGNVYEAMCSNGQKGNLEGVLLSERRPEIMEPIGSFGQGFSDGNRNSDPFRTVVFETGNSTESSSSCYTNKRVHSKDQLYSVSVPKNFLQNTKKYQPRDGTIIYPRVSRRFDKNTETNFNRFGNRKFLKSVEGMPIQLHHSPDHVIQHGQVHKFSSDTDLSYSHKKCSAKAYRYRKSSPNKHYQWFKPLKETHGNTCDTPNGYLDEHNYFAPFARDRLSKPVLSTFQTVRKNMTFDDLVFPSDMHNQKMRLADRAIDLSPGKKKNSTIETRDKCVQTTDSAHNHRKTGKDDDKPEIKASLSDTNLQPKRHNKEKRTYEDVLMSGDKMVPLSSSQPISSKNVATSKQTTKRLKVPDNAYPISDERKNMTEETFGKERNVLGRQNPKEGKATPSTQDIEIVLGDDVTVQEFMKCFMGGLDLQLNNSGVSSLPGTVNMVARAPRGRLVIPPDDILEQQSDQIGDSLAPEEPGHSSGLNRSRNHSSVESFRGRRSSGNAKTKSPEKIARLARNQGRVHKKKTAAKCQGVHLTADCNAKMVDKDTEKDDKDAIEVAIDTFVSGILKERRNKGEGKATGREKKTRKALHEEHVATERRQATSPQKPVWLKPKGPSPYNKTNIKQDLNEKSEQQESNMKLAWWERSALAKPAFTKLSVRPVNLQTHKGQKNSPTFIHLKSKSSKAKAAQRYIESSPNKIETKKEDHELYTPSTTSASDTATVFWSSPNPERRNRGQLKRKQQLGGQLHQIVTQKDATRICEKRGPKKSHVTRDLKEDEKTSDDTLKDNSPTDVTKVRAKGKSGFPETGPTPNVHSVSQDCEKGDVLKESCQETSGCDLSPRKSCCVMNLFRSRKVLCSPEVYRRRIQKSLKKKSKAMKNFQSCCSSSPGSSVGARRKKTKRIILNKTRISVTKNSVKKQKHKTLSQKLMEKESIASGVLKAFDVSTAKADNADERKRCNDNGSHSPMTSCVHHRHDNHSSQCNSNSVEPRDVPCRERNEENTQETTATHQITEAGCRFNKSHETTTEMHRRKTCQFVEGNKATKNIGGGLKAHPRTDLSKSEQKAKSRLKSQSAKDCEQMWQGSRSARDCVDKANKRSSQKCPEGFQHKASDNLALQPQAKPTIGNPLGCPETLYHQRQLVDRPHQAEQPRHHRETSESYVYHHNVQTFNEISESDCKEPNDTSYQSRTTDCGFEDYYCMQNCTKLPDVQNIGENEIDTDVSTGRQSDPSPHFNRCRKNTTTVADNRTPFYGNVPDQTRTALELQTFSRGLSSNRNIYHMEYMSASEAHGNNPHPDYDQNSDASHFAPTAIDKPRQEAKRYIEHSCAYRHSYKEGVGDEMHALHSQYTQEHPKSSSHWWGGDGTEALEAQGQIDRVSLDHRSSFSDVFQDAKAPGQIEVSHNPCRYKDTTSPLVCIDSDRDPATEESK